MASDTTTFMGLSPFLCTIGLASVILWVSSTLYLRGVRGLFIDLVLQLLEWVVSTFFIFGFFVFNKAVPNYTDEPVKLNVLSSLRIGIWTTIFTLLAVFWGFIIIRRRRELGLRLWLPGFAIGWLAFAIQLYLVGGYGWDEFRYALQLPRITVLNGIILAKKIPKAIWFLRMEERYSSYTADEAI